MTPARSTGAADILSAARAAGIVDSATGAPRPLDQAMSAARGARVVIARAADGEPGVETARRIAEHRAAEVVAGLASVVAFIGAREGIVAVEERATDACRALTEAGGRVARVPDVARCDDAADLAWDAARTRDALVVDASALVELAARTPVTERWISIAGAVERPGVRAVPVGATVEDVVRGAGGATCGPAWIALGDGPLTGRPLDRDDVVTKATRALFVTAASSDLARRLRVPFVEQLRRSMSACERCTACSDVCPPRLLGGRLRADELVRALTRAGTDWLEVAAAVECTACGLCDVACPSGLSPSRLVSAAARAAADRHSPRTGMSAAGMSARMSAAHACPSPGVSDDRNVRRLALSVVARRLGLAEDAPVIAYKAPVTVDSVSIPLKQSLGVAARPCVAVGARVERGALVAVVPEDAPGVSMHASITGVVTEIADGAVTIRAC